MTALRAIMAEPDPRIFVSAASIWEIEIKRATGRLNAPPELTEMVDTAGFERLPITSEHAQAAGLLPPHHGDPFDRMLIAQAQLERLTLVSADQAMARYDVELLGAEPD